MPGSASKEMSSTTRHRAPRVAHTSEATTRIAMGVEYDGHPFCGWQYQDHSPSVQEAVETALTKVADAPVRVICAGRTDTGVHGIGQVVHFDTPAQRSERSWVMGANANLPKSVAIQWARPVSEEFHARFSARRRWYRYVIFNRPVRPTFLQHRVAWAFRPLDETRMQAAAQPLLGEHDFNAYRAQACQAKSPVRTLYRLDVARQGEFIVLDLEANGFLHHMVRNIAGVLMAIGAGEQDVGWSAEVLAQRDRRLGGVTAPACGLYFVGVDYPPEFGVPAPSSPPVVWPAGV